MSEAHQLDIFDALVVDTPPPYNGTLTSFEAAESMRPHVAGQRALILGFLSENGPASAETIANVLRMPGDSVRPRLVELRKAHLVVEAGEGLTRKGRRCITWGAA